MTSERKPPNPSLQKKTAARTAAVQCLYRHAMNATALNPALEAAQLKKQLANNSSEQKLQVGMAVEPNYTLFEALLQGSIDRADDVEKRLATTLSTDWKRERMSTLLLAILQCGIFELFFYKDTAPKILIDEYTRLTRSFFADHEVGFVHGALSKLSQTYHG